VSEQTLALSNTAQATTSAHHAGAIAQFAVATKNVERGLGDGIPNPNQSQNPALTFGPPLDLSQSKGWTEHQTNEGRKYYYHAETEKSSWSIPKEIQSKEQRKFEETTPWREYRIWDGRKFFYNEETKVACWVAPPEVAVSYDHETETKEDPIPKTRREKMRLYMAMLAEHNVDLSWTFSMAESSCKDDPRVNIIPVERKRQAFVEHVSLTHRKRQVEEQNLKIKAREFLLEELLEWPELVLTTTYSQACGSSLPKKSKVWNFLTNTQRQEVFDDAMNQFAERLRAKQRRDTVDAVPDLQVKFVTHPHIRPDLRWDEVKFILRKDETFNRLEPLEALRVWKAYQMLDVIPEEDSAGAQKDREGRKKRERFISLLDDLRANGKTGVPWEEIYPMIKDLEEVEALAECDRGSSAETLYHFYEIEHQRKRPRFDVEA